MVTITAAHLYDHVACPHRVHLDSFGTPADRDEISPFVRLLWERGSAFEAKVVSQLEEGEVLSFRDLAPSDREAATIAAMEGAAPVIYGGRISAEDLLGEPDLLIRRGDGYIAADIKSGRGEEGDPDEDDGKLKPHYAVQVALYTDVLLKLGHGIGRQAEIWDIRGVQVPYDLDTPRHSKTSETWWDVYNQSVDAVREILGGGSTLGALASACKLCHWYSYCRSQLTAAGDLTLIPFLGRSLRDSMYGSVTCISDFAAADPETFIQGKKTVFSGLGPDRLRLFHQRARMLLDPQAKPILRGDIELPNTQLEIFFDIESDPMHDVVYLHGFVERHNCDPSTEKFTAFFASGTDLDAERQAFADAISWLKERGSAAVYYYSKYERTMYRKLCQRHEGVCSADDIDSLFEFPRSVDLYYDVVFRATEWPTNDHSIKTLAKHLGFSWRDTDPSGAASIEWYHRFLETDDPDIKQRILDYNEDDCRATAVLLDGIRRLQ